MCGTAFGSDALREQQAVITRIFHQPSAGLYQTLPQTRQRPVGNPARQHQTPPQVPPVCTPSHSATTAPSSTETDENRAASLSPPAAFLDPLLRGPSFFVKPHHPPA